jgi:hypothetical protein
MAGISEIRSLRSNGAGPLGKDKSPIRPATNRALERLLCGRTSNCSSCAFVYLLSVDYRGKKTFVMPNINALDVCTFRVNVDPLFHIETLIVDRASTSSRPRILANKNYTACLSIKFFLTMRVAMT